MNSCCASSSLPGAAPAASSSTLNARPPSWKSSASVFAITFLICGFNKAGLCCYRSRRDPEPKKLCAALQPDGRWWQIVAQHCFQTSRYPSKCPFIAAEWTKLLWTQWGGSLGRRQVFWFRPERRSRHRNRRGGRNNIVVLISDIQRLWVCVRALDGCYRTFTAKFVAQIRLFLTGPVWDNQNQITRTSRAVYSSVCGDIKYIKRLVCGNQSWMLFTPSWASWASHFILF